MSGDLIERWFDGDLAAEEVGRLDAALASDPELARAFVRAARLDHHLSFVHRDHAAGAAGGTTPSGRFAPVDASTGRQGRPLAVGWRHIAVVALAAGLVAAAIAIAWPVRGPVLVEGEASFTDGRPVTRERTLAPGTRLATEAGGRALLRWPDRSTLLAYGDTSFSVATVDAVDLDRGRIEVQAVGAMTVATPFTVADARGARFTVAVDDERTSIDAFTAGVRAHGVDASGEIAPGTTWNTAIPAVPSTGLLAWLRADDASLDAAGRVQAVPDRAGRVGAASQSDARRRPRRVALAGRSALHFTGADEALGFTCPIDRLAAMTVILVAAPGMDLPPDVNSTRAAVFWDETDFWGHVYLSPFRDGVAWRFGTGQVDNRQIWMRPTPSGEASVITTMKHAGTDALRIDGVEVQRLGGKIGWLGNCSAAAWIGFGRESTADHGSTPPSGWVGDLAEILVYGRALSDRELQRLEAYLAQRYRIRR